jgi:hypothetical protein
VKGPVPLRESFGGLLLVVGALDEAHLHERAERPNIRERLGGASRRAGRAPEG